MAQEDPRREMAKKTIVYQVPGAENVTVAQNVPYCDFEGRVLTMDVYYPPDSSGTAPLPAVVFVSGYSDLITPAMAGCQFKEMGQYISWGRAMAASGLVAITYETNEPVTDIHELLAYVRQNASSLGIDENKIGVWSCSGNVPVALSVLMQAKDDSLKCAILYYGFMLDSESSNVVVETAKRIGFANPCTGKTIDDLPYDIPLLIVRAGQDSPNLNETIGRFLGGAVIRNIPVTFINYPDGVHAFDIFNDTETSREIIRQTLAFMKFHLPGL